MFSEDFVSKPNSRTREKRKDSFELNAMKKMKASKSQKDCSVKYKVFYEYDEDDFGSDKFN